ncbi:hypothetical protein ACP0HM_11780 [Escherichia coli]
MVNTILAQKPELSAQLTAIGHRISTRRRKVYQLRSDR